MLKIMTGILILSIHSFAFAAESKNHSVGCEIMDKPHMQADYKMCMDAYNQMKAAILVSQAKGCTGMNTPEFQDEYKTCIKVKRLPASK